MLAVERAMGKGVSTVVLENWLEDYCPGVLREWEESEVAEFLDLKDWVQEAYPEVWDDFTSQFSFWAQAFA